MSDQATGARPQRAAELAPRPPLRADAPRPVQQAAARPQQAPTRPQQTAPRAPAPAAGPVAVHVRVDGDGGWWLAKIPGRLWTTLMVVTSPLRALVWILDGLVATCVLAVVALGWAWWTERITDDQVAEVLGQIGARGLSILSKSGVL